MREVFHQSLEDVQGRLVEIAELVTVAIDKATRAFSSSDVALAEEVIEADAVIDEKAIALDELAIEILARQQPVARDLRIVVSALRISASLERMGDIAEHIAQLTRMRFPERAIPKGLKSTFTKMGELDVNVARKLTELLRTEDQALAEEIRNDDDKLDDLHVSVFEKVLSDSWQGEASATVDATLASRYHERFADHAVSVAKKVVYLSTGDWTVETDAIDVVRPSTPFHERERMPTFRHPLSWLFRPRSATSCPGWRRRQHRRPRPRDRGTHPGRSAACRRRGGRREGCRSGC
jgi:phosphate transport system protein